MAPDRRPGAGLGGFGAGHDDAQVELVGGQRAVAVAGGVVGREVDRGIGGGEDLAGHRVVAEEVAAAVRVVPGQGRPRRRRRRRSPRSRPRAGGRAGRRTPFVVVGHALVGAEEQVVPVRRSRAQWRVLELGQHDQHVLGPDCGRRAAPGLGGSPLGLGRGQGHLVPQVRGHLGARGGSAVGLGEEPGGPQPPGGSALGEGPGPRGVPHDGVAGEGLEAVDVLVAVEAGGEGRAVGLDQGAGAGIGR